MRHLLMLMAMAPIAACRPGAPEPGTPPGPAAAPGSGDCATDLESVARAALTEAGRPGAIVVIDLETGQEITTVHAGIDPEATIHPASTLKSFLAAAALEQGVIAPDEPITCSGHWRRGDVELTCFAEHGPLDLSSALATSCNAYFYEVAARLGPDGVAEAFRRVGLDDLAAAELAAKDMPTAIATAIGHADARVTPRALAAAYASFVGDGDPRLAPVHAGLRAAVESEEGTASAARVDGLAVAGKTGTAETGDPDHLHAWFVGYAPADAPRVVVLAYVDADQGGGKAAAPVAGRVIAAWHERCPATLPP